MRGFDQPVQLRHAGRARHAECQNEEARRPGGPGDALGDGGKGAAELARIVVGLCDKPSKPSFVYEDADTLWDKINKIAKKVYRASEVTADAKVRAQIKRFQDDGYGHYPVCVAKTQSSFTTDPRCAARRTTTS